MTAEVFIDIACHLGAALLAGGLIGLERSFNGRPAGFRTHVLVCVASALLMLVTTNQALWLRVPVETVRTDPTRMAQGIMTGIGFLGAGVIFKEGLIVRGLTTAASIWMTAAIGTLLGIGLFVPAALATAIALFTLAVFRLIEAKMPTRYFARGIVRTQRATMLPEAELRDLLQRHHFSIATMSYQLRERGEMFEYQLLIRTIDRKHLRGLCSALLETPNVVEFQLTMIAS